MYNLFLYLFFIRFFFLKNFFDMSLEKKGKKKFCGGSGILFIAVPHRLRTPSYSFPALLARTRKLKKILLAFVFFPSLHNVSRCCSSSVINIIAVEVVIFFFVSHSTGSKNCSWFSQFLLPIPVSLSVRNKKQNTFRIRRNCFFFI